MLIGKYTFSVVKSF